MANKLKCRGSCYICTQGYVTGQQIWGVSLI